jgi:hypothetical protein
MFFTPESLTLRCLQAEGADARICGGEWYVHPDLTGMEAAVFTAGAMLYRVLSGAVPYPARDEELLHQDMREGNVPPIRLAAPGLDERLASLIQAALVSAEKTSGPADRIPRSGTALLSQLLAILKPEGRAVSGAASLFHQLSAEEQLRLAKEKDQFLKRKNLAVKTRRFVIRNTAIIAGCAAAVLIAVLMVRSVVKSRADRPTTAGMDSAQVVHSYYGAFGGLDHQLMEACVIQGAGKGDIEMVTNLFVISRVRQAYEMRGSPPLITAAEWQNAGAQPLDSQVFGVTGLEIERLSGDESAEAVRYRAVYTLWLPRQYGAENAAQEDAGSQEETAGLPVGVRYTDELTLIKNRGNWRIAEIHRAQIPR